jgi:hypothetical protein
VFFNIVIAYNIQQKRDCIPKRKRKSISNHNKNDRVAKKHKETDNAGKSRK